MYLEQKVAVKVTINIHTITASYLYKYKNYKEGYVKIHDDRAEKLKIEYKDLFLTKMPDGTKIAPVPIYTAIGPDYLDYNMVGQNWIGQAFIKSRQDMGGNPSQSGTETHHFFTGEITESYIGQIPPHGKNYAGPRSLDQTVGDLVTVNATSNHITTGPRPQDNTNTTTSTPWKYYSYVWAQIYVKYEVFLFDKKTNSVNFNNLNSEQRAIINDVSFDNNELYFGHDGNDVVVLPDTKEAALAVKFTPGQTFFGGNGDDKITGGKLSDRIDGGAGDDVIRPGAGNDFVNGGVGIDTVILNGRNIEFELGGKLKSDHKNIVVKKMLGNKIVETDILENIELIIFNNKKINITKWSELVSLSTVKSLNFGPDGKELISPKASLLEDLLGTPVYRGDGTYEHSNHIKAMLARDKSSVLIDGVKYETIKVVADSLTKIMNEASSLYGSFDGMPSIIKSLSSAGVLVPRKVAGKEDFSSHSWGTSIDLKVDGILDYVADRELHLALAKITPLFNKEGWVAGSGFSKGREDDMHFEFSIAKLTSLFATVKQGGAGNDAIDGDIKDNYLVGNGGNDTIKGGAGIDTLKGGQGNDILYGGADADFFVFDTALNPGTNVDRIKDFTIADEIELDHNIFIELGDRGHVLDASEFRAGGAKDANDHILYDRNNGRLYYDADGNGAGKAILFAVLETKPANLSHNDFFVI